MKRETMVAIHWQTYKSIEKELIDLSTYIHITDTPYKKNSGISPLNTYSNHISDLLAKCCIEIESIGRFIFEYLYNYLPIEKKSEFEEKYSNGYYNFKNIFPYLDDIFSLRQKVIHIYNPIFDLSDANKDIAPFSEKNFKIEGKEGWFNAYNTTKHDRYNKLSDGNIKNLLYACAALYLLNIYSRDITIDIVPNAPLDEWLNLGSDIFSVQKPLISEYLKMVETNFPLIDEKTPLVIRYSEKNYAIVKDIWRECTQNLHKWISSQPELHDSNFLCSFPHLSNDVSDVDKLISYRIQKYKDSQDFLSKKEEFTSSDDWMYLKYNDLLDISIDLINPHNIDLEIERLEKKFGEAKKESLFTRPLYDKIDKIPYTIYVFGYFSSVPSKPVPNTFGYWAVVGYGDLERKTK